jgi:hypothetical protein
MKKIITILAIAALALTSTFAVVTPEKISFDGNKDATPEMNVTLKSSLEQTNYELSLLYSSVGYELHENTYIYGYDLTKKGNTRNFRVMISNGNLNNTITFVTEITVRPFVGKVDGKNHETNNNLRVSNSDGENQTTFSTEIAAGPQVKQSVAKFYFNWDADTELPAGKYSSTNTINISVS